MQRHSRLSYLFHVCAGSAFAFMLGSIVPQSCMVGVPTYCALICAVLAHNHVKHLGHLLHMITVKYGYCS